MTLQPPPPTADSRNASALRDLLRRAGYTRDGIQAALGVAGDVLARPLERPVYLRRLHGGGALETLIRVFLLDEPQDSAVVEQAIAPTSLKSLQALGVVEGSAGQVRGLVRIVPHGEILLVSDLPTSSPDHVAGVHWPSVTLADLTIRRPVHTALDVGTGCGIQAILASRHSKSVVATDVNERALAFARLNAALNGIDNIEFRLGSFFEPVAGETFGLVVCNPPYVISPETTYLFRDSGLGRDQVSERLVGELPAFLEEGGFGTIMASWIQEGDDTTARPRTWLAGTGCDAWILHTGIDDALTAAANWNRDLANDGQIYGEAIDRWTAYFRDEGIRAVAYGAIAMRRRTAGSNWVRSRVLPNETRVHPQDHMLRLFTGPDLSNRAPDDAALAQQRLALAEGSLITIRHRFGPDGWAEAAELTLDIGIPFSAELDRPTAEFLAQLDGSRSLGEVLEAFALNDQARAEHLRAAGLAIARTLLELGLVVESPVEDAQTHD